MKKQQPSNFREIKDIFLEATSSAFAGWHIGLATMSISGNAAIHINKEKNNSPYNGELIADITCLHDSYDTPETLMITFSGAKFEEAQFAAIATSLELKAPMDASLITINEQANQIICPINPYTKALIEQAFHTWAFALSLSEAIPKEL